jgi:septum formation protein
MSEAIESPQLILASTSPRRRYLLRQAGLEFVVIPSQIDEAAIRLSAPNHYVMALSQAKANAIAEKYPQSWIIGADTIVVIGDKILGKPVDPAQARRMLTELSGRTHQVYTGYTICCHDRQRSFTDAICTDVHFKNLSEDEIEWYILSGEPFDKAGAYAIQGLGTFLVKSIHGSYTNVVGLPVCEVVEFLIKEKILRYPGKKGGVAIGER